MALSLLTLTLEPLASLQVLSCPHTGLKATQQQMLAQDNLCHHWNKFWWRWRWRWWQQRCKDDCMEQFLLKEWLGWHRSSLVRTPSRTMSRVMLMLMLTVMLMLEKVLCFSSNKTQRTSNQFFRFQSELLIIPVTVSQGSTSNIFTVRFSSHSREQGQGFFWMHYNARTQYHAKAYTILTPFLVAPLQPWHWWGYCTLRRMIMRRMTMTTIIMKSWDRVICNCDCHWDCVTCY